MSRRWVAAVGLLLGAALVTTGLLLAPFPLTQLFTAVIAASIILGLLFMVELGWPPSKRRPEMAWLQWTLAATAVAFDIVLLLAIHQWFFVAWLALAILVVQDVVFAWRLFKLWSIKVEEEGD